MARFLATDPHSVTKQNNIPLKGEKICCTKYLKATYDRQYSSYNYKLKCSCNNRLPCPARGQTWYIPGTESLSVTNQTERNSVSPYRQDTPWRRKPVIYKFQKYGMCRSWLVSIFWPVPLKHTLGCGSVKDNKNLTQITNSGKFHAKNSACWIYATSTQKVLCPKMQPKLLGNKKTQTNLTEFVICVKHALRG